MSDIEIVKACAAAMGYTDTLMAGGKFYCTVPEPPEWAKKVGATGRGAFVFDPLHDDAQAMALLKKFSIYMPLGILNSSDLNRAICLCVARMAEQGKGGE